MNKDRTTVFYDGACPLCAREISCYRNLTGSNEINWVDVATDFDSENCKDLSQENALRRFHVRTKAGILVSGGEAFIELWANFSYFKILANVLRWWPLRWMINRFYDGFLKIRPHLQSWIQ